MILAATAFFASAFAFFSCCCQIGMSTLKAKPKDHPVKALSTLRSQVSLLPERENIR